MALTTDQCLILAAGNGSRLVSKSGGLPKPLVPLHDVPLLAHVVLSACEAGVGDFVIVVGYRGEMIRHWFANHRPHGARITFVENREYERGNGSSVLEARQQLCGPFLLVMADHIFEPRTARMMLKQQLEPGEAILATDRKLDTIFDLDDATKVRCDGSRIAEIGKELTDYNALDTGMFLCGPSLFRALDRAANKGMCSLSDGMRALIREDKLRSFDIGDAHWQDVDTPEALAYAEGIFDRDFSRTPVAEQLARA
ncbi:MAG: NTP transferase domain-containing protein [Acidobacteriaceae bacterium]|nr:NTP transferase domain-containing protein [Acidobacteriaceae bacterium]MBV8571994.1 NTP transferase domain-containing protein [Acidobacteriaceae bacterium]